MYGRFWVIPEVWGQALKVGIDQFGSSDYDKVWEIFKRIEMDADRRFSEPVSNEPALPTVHLEEDDGFNPMVNDEPPVDVAEIPF